MLNAKIEGKIRLELIFGNRDIVFAPFADRSNKTAGVSFEQFASSNAAKLWIKKGDWQLSPDVNLIFDDAKTIDLVISTLETCKAKLAEMQEAERGGDNGD